MCYYNKYDKYKELHRDHIASTTFLYKIVPSVNLQKIHQNCIKWYSM